MTHTTKIVIDTIGIIGTTAVLLSQALRRFHDAQMEKALMRLAPTRPQID